MADITLNISKGRSVELYRRVNLNDPASSQLVLVLLQTVEADSTLIDYDTLGDLLGAAGNVECDFTNYARVTYSDSDLAATNPDDANDRYEFSLPVKSIANAGGATNNTIVKSILCYDGPGTNVDANLVPMKAFDANETTNGQTLNIPAAVVSRAS